MIDKKNTVEAIYSDLLKKIIDLELKPGEKISENRTGAYYGVSRTIIRGAFRILQENGFLVVVPKSGTYVSKINISYIKAAILLRAGLEKEILVRAIRNSDEKENLLSKLKKTYQLQKKFVEEDVNPHLFNRFDSVFHEDIFRCHEEYDMRKLIDTHMNHLNRWRNLNVIHGYSQQTILKEHEELIRAIEDENIERIGRVIDAHTSNTMWRGEPEMNTNDYFV